MSIQHPDYTPLDTGQHFGQYQIRRLLDRNTMAEVYRAYSPELDAEVLLKVLDVIIRSDEQAVKLQHRFFHEISASATLQHPNIMPILDFNVVNDRYYIAMQLIEGPTLRDVLSERRSGLPQDAALGLFRQIADAVNFAHTKNIIHQDIRPGNIVIVDGKRPVVNDFGLLRVVTDTETTTATFSPRAPLYMSPEQASGVEVSPRADIYSLGVLLYEMVTGDVPFRGGSAARILVQHMQQNPRPPSELTVDLDPRVEIAILRALSKDPATRFSSPLAMIEALSREFDTEKYDTITLTREATDSFRKRVEEVKEMQQQAVDASVPQTTPSSAMSNTTIMWIAIGVVVVVVILLLIMLNMGG